ncbi:DUF4198 domain-containing protein [soil metagenome]
MSAAIARRLIDAAVVASLCAATPAFAHHPWLLPSSTVLSSHDSVITVDAAVSSDLFNYDTNSLKLDTLVVTAPDGKPLAPQNPVTSRFRSSFDVPLASAGTYKVAIVNDGVFASWKEDGKPKRWRGTVEAFAKEVPANAQDLEVTQTSNRVESFFTRDKPTTTAFKSTGSGLELMPVTHPNDLVAGDPASFQILVDGKPAANVKVTAIRGDSRYRNNVDELTATTGVDGRFTLKWPQAGMWWVGANLNDNQTALKQAKQRRLSYAATVEVMAP